MTTGGRGLLLGAAALLLLPLLVGCGGCMSPPQPEKAKPVYIAFGPIQSPEPPARAFERSEHFEPIPKPGPNDWLAAHPEVGQRFEELVASRPNKPDGARRKLYFQPLGEFKKDAGPSLERLERFASAYFAMEVEIRPPLAIEGLEITARKNPHTGGRQLLTRDIMALLSKRLPDDAYAMLGITMSDLYPEPTWNFVFGQASLRERVGVYSFARYDPRFYGEARGSDWEALMLRRSLKVLAHETGHMFGIHHCTFYSCVMNGSNHLEETDWQPLHLCPVDLRKLHWSIGFDVLDRYKKLR
ncbi:MAG TPA: archaemetzincin, partial [Polyangiaceae bacterium]|nr:archaemetzincin [Polyangiaceae bacterium]